MRVVTRRTGLSAELLRVWERRYRVVTPGRTQTGRRLYSDAEIERLRLLYRATLAGRSIGTVARLSMPALTALVRQDAEADRSRAGTGSIAADSAPTGEIVDKCVRAVERLDVVTLENLLRRAAVALSAPTFLDALVAPLLEQIGTRWRDGTFRPVHEHLASAVIRRALDRAIESASSPGLSPDLLVATPVGQMHELGALLVAAVAAAEGWSIAYLGASVPAEDIAEAAITLGVRAICLSLVYPPNDRAIGHELRRLRALLPKGMALFAGGAAASAYGEVLDEIGAEPARDLAALRARLRAWRQTLRTRRRAAPGP
jgi:methanogenic corrinoid protein MtbC1